MKLKNFLPIFILILMLPLTAFATVALQETGEAEITGLTFIQFTLEFLAATFVGLLLPALKHLFGGTWSWSSFWSNSLKPQLWAMAGAVVLIALQYFLPQYKIFVEMAIDGEISLDHSKLLATGSILALVIKGVLNAKKTNTEA